MHLDPAALVIMGVSGSGKTTIAVLLAGRLRWELADADSFHSPANLQKMRRGIPLTDEDRWPWLHAIAAWIDETRRVGGRQDVRLVYLKGDAQLIGQLLPKGTGTPCRPLSCRASSTHWRSPGPTRIRSSFRSLPSLKRSPLQSSPH